MSKRTYYGGQAVIEGVMMRGRKHMVTAVRRPAGGIALEDRPLPGLYVSKWRRMPLVRGIVALIEALVLGIQVLMYSANIALEEEDTKLSGGAMWLTMAAGMVFAVAVFFLLPLFITRPINPYINSSILFHLIEGVIRLAIFILYLKIVSMLPDIRRVYQYHGAEHKTVNAYEAGDPLEVSAARKYSTAHVRCGTSFLFAVMVVAIIVFSLVGRPALWIMILARIVLVPVVAALGYEVTYFAGRHTTNPVVRTILAPGLWMQKLTTKQPDDSMLEVAVAALTKVMELDAADEAAAPTAQPAAAGPAQ